MFLWLAYRAGGLSSAESLIFNKPRQVPLRIRIQMAGLVFGSMGFSPLDTNNRSKEDLPGDA
jgi:hypothetical protein